jgi:hypothetical protein
MIEVKKYFTLIVQSARLITANEEHRYGLRYELISVFISEKLDFISVSISE